MAIDSICSGCGKTLRVGDEFAGRKARCPLCGVIYEVSPFGNAADRSHAVPETSYSPLKPTDAAGTSLPTLQPLADSWSSLSTTEPRLSTPAASSNPSASLGQSAPNQSQVVPNASGPKYFVRTPSQAVYGPADDKTINEWIAQGRLDDTCHIRHESSDQWIGIPAWKFQQKRTANPVVGGITPNDQSSNYFGTVPVATNQSAGFAKSGNGIWILLLGILGWIVCPTVIGGFLCGIPCIIMAQSELANVRNGRSPESERPLALIGMWLSIINIVFSTGFVFLIIVTAILN